MLSKRLDPHTVFRKYVTDIVQISKEEFLNPIKQDIKKGKLRFVRNCFPHKGYLWNYGAFPRVCYTTLERGPVH